MPRANEIHDRAALTDHICDVMQEAYRSTTIDTLLTHPLDAVRMALQVGVKSGRFPNAAARRVERSLQAIETDAAHAVPAINEILRCALSSRKRGEFRHRKGK